MGFSKVCVLFFFLYAIQVVVFVSSTEFEVGDKGWEVPKSKNDQDMYNKWASKNRFKVNDTLNFSYKKGADSVLVVTEAEYKKCQSEKPIFNSTNGDSIFKLDRPGSFFFISGADGHCEKGQKMIVKVLAPPTPAHDKVISQPPTQSANQNATAASAEAEAPASIAHHNVEAKSGAEGMHAAAAVTVGVAVVSFFGVFLF